MLGLVLCQNLRPKICKNDMLGQNDCFLEEVGRVFGVFDGNIIGLKFLE